MGWDLTGRKIEFLYEFYFSFFYIKKIYKNKLNSPPFLVSFTHSLTYLLNLFIQSFVLNSLLHLKFAPSITVCQKKIFAGLPLNSNPIFFIFFLLSLKIKNIYTLSHQVNLS